MVTETFRPLTPHDILSINKLWNQNKSLIFLVDLEIQEQLKPSDLSIDEKEYIKTLKTNYFKKRFTVSRSFIKCILSHILRKTSQSEISLYQNDSGRVCVHNHDDIYICISYTDNIAAISISKMKIGIDIEYIRPLNIRNLSKSLKKIGSEACIFEKENIIDTIKIWTLREAYCKLADQSMLACLNKEIDLKDIYDQELSVFDKYILTIVFNTKDSRTNKDHLDKYLYFFDSEMLLNYTREFNR